MDARLCVLFIFNGEKDSPSMPAIDQCEPNVIRALEKEGWSVLDQPVTLQTGGQTSPYIYADLLLQHRDHRPPIIVVEVKCFPKGVFTWDEFYSMVGQYLVYRSAIRLFYGEVPLYLALPSFIEAVFSTAYPLAPLVLDEIDVKLIIVDLESEVIVRWKH